MSYVCTECYTLHTITKSPLDNVPNIFRQRDAFYDFLDTYIQVEEKKVRNFTCQALQLTLYVSFQVFR